MDSYKREGLPSRFTFLYRLQITRYNEVGEASTSGYSLSNTPTFRQARNGRGAEVTPPIEGMFAERCKQSCRETLFPLATCVPVRCEHSLERFKRKQGGFTDEGCND